MQSDESLSEKGALYVVLLRRDTDCALCCIVFVLIGNKAMHSLWYSGSIVSHSAVACRSRAW